MVAEHDEYLAVEVPTGTVMVSAASGGGSQAWATVVFAHGAGSRFDHPFILGFTRALRDAGARTLRFNFPYSQAGRRMPGPPGHAIATWTAAMRRAGEADGGGPIWAAGRSYGGRMASMATAAGEIVPAGLVYLGYPLHPPGRPDALRAAHLPAITAPQLFVSGRSDPFVDPRDQLEAAVAACPDATLRWVDGGHSFDVKGRTVDTTASDLAGLVAGFIRSHA